MFTLHTVRLNGDTPLLLNCLKGHNLNIAATEENMITAGSIYGRFNSILSQDSTITFDTYSIETLITLCNLVGMPIGSTSPPIPAPPYTSVDLFFACYDVFGRLKGASSHIKINITRALLHWTTLAVNTNQDASMSCTLSVLDPASPGVLPITVTTGESLPTTGSGDDVRFSLGPTTLANIDTGCLQSLNINLNQTVEFLRCSSDVYPKALRAGPIKPTLTLATQKTDMLSTGAIPYAGLELLHSDTVIYLRQRENNQVGFKDGSDHIMITVAGMARVASHTSTASEPGVVTVNISTIDDGTDAPIVFATGEALP